MMLMMVRQHTHIMYVPSATAIFPDEPPVSDEGIHPQVHSMKDLCSRLGLDGNEVKPNVRRTTYNDAT